MLAGFCPKSDVFHFLIGLLIPKVAFNLFSSFDISLYIFTVMNEVMLQSDLETFNLIRLLKRVL